MIRVKYPLPLWYYCYVSNKWGSEFEKWSDYFCSWMINNSFLYISVKKNLKLVNKIYVSIKMFSKKNKFLKQGASNELRGVGSVPSYIRDQIVCSYCSLISASEIKLVQFLSFFQSRRELWLAWYSIWCSLARYWAHRWEKVSLWSTFINCFIYQLVCGST